MVSIFTVVAVIALGSLECLSTTGPTVLSEQAAANTSSETITKYFFSAGAINLVRMLDRA